MTQGAPEDPVGSTVEQAAPAATAPRKRRLGWIIGGGIAVLAAAGVLTASLMGAFTAPEPVKTEEPRRSTTPAPTQSPTPTPTPTPSYPAPILDVPEVKEMPYSPVWRPADEGQYFWQIVDPAYGYPKEGGTKYLLAHACDNRECAGDEFRRLEAGDTLTYDGAVYQVKDKWQIMKTDIAAQPIWTHKPGRLVIITCIIETTWEFSDKNDVFIAERVQ